MARRSESPDENSDTVQTSQKRDIEAVEPSRTPDADPAQDGRGIVLTPGEKTASRWNGALRSRLNRLPLEAFLRNHEQLCALGTTQAVTENLVRACMLMVEPVLPHRGAAWPALLHRGYFDALGEAVSRISRALGELIEEPQLWRVSSLVGVARLLTPNLGIDMAAAAAATAVAASLSEQRTTVFEETLGILATIAVNSGYDRDLDEVRSLVSRGLAGSVEGGASTLLSAPHLTTISAEPPSNH